MSGSFESKQAGWRDPLRRLGGQFCFRSHPFKKRCDYGNEAARVHLRPKGLGPQLREQYSDLTVRQGNEGREPIKRLATVGEEFEPAVLLSIGKCQGKGLSQGP